MEENETQSSNHNSNEEQIKAMNEIEKQLHKQYATNNNSNLGTIVSLMVGLFAVIGFYTHVFIGSSYVFEKIPDNEYSLIDLCIAAIGAFIAFGIMAYLCIYQGIYQRREQFVVWAIRKKYYGENYNKPKIFPDSYKPFGKNGIEIIQGLYGEFVKIIIFVFVCVLISLSFNIGTNIYKFNDNGLCCTGIISIIAVALVINAVAVLCLKCFYKEKQRCHDLEHEYLKVENENNEVLNSNESEEKITLIKMIIRKKAIFFLRN